MFNQILNSLIYSLIFLGYFSLGLIVLVLILKIFNVMEKCSVGFLKSISIIFLQFYFNLILSRKILNFILKEDERDNLKICFSFAFVSEKILTLKVSCFDFKSMQFLHSNFLDIEKVIFYFLDKNSYISKNYNFSSFYKESNLCYFLELYKK